MTNTSIRRAALSLLLVGLVSCGGSEGPGTTEPEPARATSMTISQSTVSLTFLGQTLGLTATVLDQSQRPMAVTKIWSSDDPSIVTVTSSGQLAAVANGVTTVRATSGSVSASASVTVQQVATWVAAVSGEGQTGPVAQALPELVVVRSQDQGGAPVAGATVMFTAADGNGSVTVAEATTDAEALASTAWTLGNTSGAQVLNAVIAGATSGAAISATAVAGPPAALAKVSGDNQTGPLGVALFEPVVVKLTDEFGNGVVGGSVSFAVTGGSGSVTPSQAATVEDGAAQASWTLGAALGVNTLSVSGPGLTPVTFTATAGAAKADLAPGAIATSPSNPTALQAFEVSTQVTNVGFATAGAGVQVQLLLDGTAVGTVALPTLAAGASSEAAFNVGPLSAGSHALRIVVDPAGALDEWDETNNEAQHTTSVPVTTLITAGTPVSNISAADSVEHLFTLEVPASSPGTIEITLEGGTGDADLYVQFGDRPAHRDDYTTCVSGNPTTTERCVINAAEPGTYHILVFAWTAFSGTTLLATTGGEVIPYNIELVFINSGTPAQDEVFQEAADLWMKVIPGDISDFDFSFQPVPANTCIEGQPIIDGLIDDLLIYVDIIEIDGIGGTLAQAGPCQLRGIDWIPTVGIMQFDAGDLDALAADNELLPIVMHEMGHVLGFGTIWGSNFKDLVRNPSRPSNAGADTHFTGPRAIVEFDAAGAPTQYTLGEKVPVANDAKEGSADAHWRESVLNAELMTPFFDSGRPNPLSAITIASLADMGYTVDISQAEPYGASYRAQALADAPGTVVDLRGDLWPGPIFVRSSKGAVKEVIRR